MTCTTCSDLFESAWEGPGGPCHRPQRPNLCPYPSSSTSMGIHLALLAHWLATGSWVRSLLPWCPDHPLPPRQTGRVTRSPQLYLAVGALAHHHFFVRKVFAYVNRRDCDGERAYEVGTHNSSWLLRNRDLEKCLTCLDERTTWSLCHGLGPCYHGAPTTLRPHGTRVT